jgi:hypothetical protein
MKRRKRAPGITTSSGADLDQASPGVAIGGHVGVQLSRTPGPDTPVFDLVVGNRGSSCLTVHGVSAKLLIVIRYVRSYI